METKRLEGSKKVGGLKPACISWGLGVKWAPSEEVLGPGLPGWLGNWPPCDSAVFCAPCQLTAWGEDGRTGAWRHWHQTTVDVVSSSTNWQLMILEMVENRSFLTPNWYLRYSLLVCSFNLSSKRRKHGVSLEKRVKGNKYTDQCLLSPCGPASF